MISPTRTDRFGPLIGVFDSGVGGLSVLRALHAALPHAAWHYVADSAHAPYGERSEAFVVERSLRIAEHLHAQGCAGLVVACNTATAIAIDALRARWPQWPIVGVEPGVKPAAAATHNGRVGVLATPATLSSARYRALVESVAQTTVQKQPGKLTFVDRACPELAGLIEHGNAADPALAAAVQRHCAVLRGAGVDTVVLGCTHYAFVHAAIGAAMGPDVTIVDTAEAVARQGARRFADVPRPIGGWPEQPLQTRLTTTADAGPLQDIASAWLGFEFKVESLPGL